MPRRLLGTVVLCAGCGASADPASPRPPEAVVPSTSAVVAPPASASPPRATDGPSNEALAARLVEERDVVLFDPTDGHVIYLDTWQVEGTGEGVRVVDRRKKETVVAELEADAPREKLAPLIRALEAHLGARRFIVLEQVPWVDTSEPLRDPEAELQARFDPPHLEVRTAEGQVEASIGPPSSTPHLPRPTAVFVADGVGIVVVTIAFDPGERYGEGYNLYTEHRVLRLRP